MSRYHFLDAFQDAILVLDAEGRLHYGNGSAGVLLEVSVRRLATGKPSAQFIQFSPDPFEGGALKKVTDTTQMVEVSFTLASGKPGWVQVVFQPEPEFFAHADIDGKDQGGDKRRWFMSMRDVTLEKALHVKYRKELEEKESVINDLKDARARLEEYSQGLEAKVEERTAEVREKNRLLKVILDSLGQGILVFDKNGVCLPVYSLFCRKVFEVDPPGHTIERLLEFNEKASADFKEWRDLAFDGPLEFEDLVPLAPAQIKLKKGLDVGLNYCPMLDADNRLAGIVVVATDRTREIQALRKFEAERETFSKVTQVVKNRDSFRLFISEAERRIAKLASVQGVSNEEIARDLHTIKGASASFSLNKLASACHEIESEFHERLKNPSEDLAAWFGQCSGRLKNILAGELNVLTEMLGPVVGGQSRDLIDIPLSRLEKWRQALLAAHGAPGAAAIRVAQEIHDECTQKPLATSIGHLGAGLKELATSYGKRLGKFQVSGGDIRVSSDRFEPLLSSLIHAFRNSVYHGLETPDERMVSGKPGEGVIKVSFKLISDKSAGQPNQTVLAIDIEDDGKGVDPARVRKKLLSKGRQDLANRSDHEVIQEILGDDFSTAESIDMVAGRGVGMSAIAEEVRKLSGTIEVRSTVGKGMSLVIRVPFETHSEPSTKTTAAA